MSAVNLAKPVRLVVFDLDGTLIDSSADIAHSVNELRAGLDLEPLPLPQVESYIGNGVRKLLERALPGAEVEAIDSAHEAYLEIYRRRLLDTTLPYPGVHDALDQLACDGRTLAVWTNKPRYESVSILDGLELTRHFETIYGGDSFERKKPDPVGVDRLRSETGTDASETLFVGDTHVDLETARSAGVSCALVTYGMHREAATTLQPDFWIDDLRELTRIVGVLS